MSNKFFFMIAVAVAFNMTGSMAFAGGDKGGDKKYSSHHESGHHDSDEHHGDHDGDHKPPCNGQNQSCPQITNYHDLYASIQSTEIFVQDLELRTDTGAVIDMPFTPQMFDFTKLNQIFQGIPLDLTNFQFPGDVSSVNVVEIRLRTGNQGNSGKITFAGNSTCNMKIQSRTISLYTTAPINVTEGVNYLVKVEFTNLDNIMFTNVPANSHSKSCHLKCTLASRRYHIRTITPFGDEG